MRSTRNWVALLGLLVVFGALGFTGLRLYAEDKDGEEKGEKSEGAIAFSDLPKALQELAAKHLGAEGPFEAEKEVEDGTVLYEVGLEKDGMDKELKATEAGVLVEIEEEMHVAQLPEAVAAAVQKAFPQAEIEEAESVQKMYYEIAIEKDGKEMELLVTPLGKIVKQEVEDE